MPGRHANRLMFLASAVLGIGASILFADDASPPADVAALTRVRACENARIEVIERLRPTVTCLFNHGNRAGGGSGVIIDSDGYGLTNFHVVAGMIDERVGDAGMMDGKIRELDVLGVDPTGDVAMFQLRDSKGIPAAPLGDSESLSVGDFALAMGNPFLLAEDYTPTVTFGIISGLHRYQAGAGDKGRALRYTDCIQVDTSINPGNSGGPLFDLGGQLIGINGRVSIEERGRVNVGVGYAISINQIKRFIPMWRAGLATKHATAGFTVADRGRRVVVDQIVESGRAYHGGLRLGDEIISFAGRDIHSANQFGSWLGVFPADWPVEVACRQNGEARTIQFRLEDLPFPRPDQGPNIFGRKGTFDRHPVAKAANSRAVTRALRRYVSSLGGETAIERLKELSWEGQRIRADKADATAIPVSWIENREALSTPLRSLQPMEMEKAVRWALMNFKEGHVRRSCRVVRSDEVGGRIVVVLEYAGSDGTNFRASFDDETGDLLRVQFEDAVTNKRVQYQYGEFSREGGLRLPHTRTLRLDEALHSVERFSRVKGAGG